MHDHTVSESAHSPANDLLDKTHAMRALSFHTPDEAIISALDERTLDGSRSLVIEKALNCYFRMLADGRASLRHQLSEAELSLIGDALNGIHLDAFRVRFLRHEIADACSVNGLHEKWGVDARALDRKFAEFSLPELVALSDAIERFWKRARNGENPTVMGILD